MLEQTHYAYIISQSVANHAFFTISHFSTAGNSTVSSTELQKRNTDLYIMKLPDAFMSTTNQLIREKSKNTAISFIYLPQPPSSLSSTNYVSKQEFKNETSHAKSDKQKARFLQLLKILTEDLPPTVLVHGIHAVTSTALWFWMYLQKHIWSI